MIVGTEGVDDGGLAEIEFIAEWFAKLVPPDKLSIPGMIAFAGEKAELKSTELATKPRQVPKRVGDKSEGLGIEVMQVPFEITRLSLKRTNI